MRAREHEKRPRRRAPAAKLGDQGLLGRTWSSPCSSMSMTRMAGPSASSRPATRPGHPTPGHRPRRAKRGSRSTRDLRIGSASSTRPRRRTALRQPLEARNAASGSVSAKALRQPCLAAAQRTGDVVQRPYVTAARTARRPTAREGRRRPGLRRLAPAIAPSRRTVGGRPRPRSSRSARTFSTVQARSRRLPFEHRLMSRQSGLAGLGRSPFSTRATSRQG